MHSYSSSISNFQDEHSSCLSYLVSAPVALALLLQNADQNTPQPYHTFLCDNSSSQGGTQLTDIVLMIYTSF